MPFKTYKSRLVGPARLADGGTTTAFRALVGHTCGQCRRTIAPGALFSRETVRRPGVGVGRLVQAPVCAACHPVHPGRV